MRLKDVAQNKTILRFWIFTSLLMMAGQMLAQEIGVNERGDSIVVYDDGSWRYFDPAVDQALKGEAQATPVAEPIEPTIVEPAKPQPVKKSKAKKPKTNKKKKPKATSKTKKSNSKKAKNPKKVKSKTNNKKSNAKKKGGKQKAKKPKKGKDVKSPTKYSNLEEERFRNQAIGKAETASQKAANLLLAYDDLTFDRVMMEDELKDAYTVPNTTDEQIVKIENRIQAQRAKENTAQVAYERVQEQANFLNKLIDISESKRRKTIAKYEKENPQFIVSNEDPANPAPVILTKNNVGPEALLSKQTLKAKKNLRTAVSVYLNPPTRECPEKNVRFNEFTGKKMVSLEKEVFFTKTPDQMRLLLKDRPYIICSGALMNTGGLTFLELEIVFASTSAERAYGLVEKGSKLSLKLISGYTISLSAFKSEPGEVNNLEKTVTFKPRYLLDKTQIKTLEKESIDQVRIVWMTGYDDYEIFDVDFLVNQIRCLKGE